MNLQHCLISLFFPFCGLLHAADLDSFLYGMPVPVCGVEREEVVSDTTCRWSAQANAAGNCFSPEWMVDVGRQIIWKECKTIFELYRDPPFSVSAHKGFLDGSGNLIPLTPDQTLVFRFLAAVRSAVSASSGFDARNSTLVSTECKAAWLNVEWAKLQTEVELRSFHACAFSFQKALLNAYSSDPSLLRLQKIENAVRGVNLSVPEKRQAFQELILELEDGGSNLSGSTLDALIQRLD